VYKRQHVWRRRPNLELDSIIENLEPESPFYFRSEYGGTLDAINTVFGPDRVYLQFYEELFSEGNVADICSFLNVDFHQPDFNHRPNYARTAEISGTEKRRIRTKLEPLYFDMKQRMGSRLPDSWWL